MSEEYLYKKVGRKYEPVSVYSNEFTESLPLDTATLTLTRKGSTSRKFRIDIAMAPLLAGAMYMQDAMCDAMLKMDTVQPVDRVPLTPEEKAAWDNLIKVGGDGFRRLNKPSYRDIVEAGATELMSHMEHILQDPTCKSAYDAFVMTVKLKLEKDNIV